MGKFKFLKRPKVFIPLLVILLVLVMMIMIVKNLNAPAEGTISQTPPTQAEKFDPYAKSGTYKGKYISFNYPPHYKSVPTKLTGSYLEVVSYHTVDVTGKQINIGVAPGNIASDSGVSYRRQHKELYKEDVSRLGVEFTKTDGTEDTFFIEHSGQLATVSMTAPYNDQSGDALFVASSLRWK